jgi:hypothetical protein
MISPILTKLYGIILGKKISIWLEIHGKRAKGWARFRSYHSTMDHLVTLRIILTCVTLRIIAKECVTIINPISFVVSLNL